MNTARTIRFEDLGEPVQRLLKSLKGGYSEEDMALLEYVSVKDMAKIYGEMSSDRHAEEIWSELRAALQARREKAARRELELLSRQQQLSSEQEAEERKRREQEALEEAKRQQAEEARRLLREGKEEAAREEEEALLMAAEEERKRKAEKKRKRREARERELREQQEALDAEREKHRAAKSSSQKEAWKEYVANHPLEFANGANQYIEQKHVEHTQKAPPQVTRDLLNRTYTPKCPNCALKFMSPPKGWDCPVCLRRLRKNIKVWQPDDASNVCMICRKEIGRFSRHHCRNCGRLVCVSCSLARAVISALGFDKPQKVCSDCAYQCCRHTINYKS